MTQTAPRSVPSPQHGDASPWDVAIVGAGPVGIELAVALKRRGLRFIHFDARQIGHTMSWWTPQSRWFSSNDRIAIAGVPLITPDGGKCTREHYLAYLRTITEMHDLHVRTYEPVKSIRREQDGIFSLHTIPRTGPASYRARNVVLATGGTERPRRLGIPGEDLPHVAANLQDPHQYFGQRLLIIGGRNSAAEAALRCHHTGVKVSLSYRGPTLSGRSIKYWILPELQGLIDAGRITAHLSTQPVEITPTEVALRRADGSIERVPVDFVLRLIGYEADMSLFREVNAMLNDGSLAPVFDPATMQTSVPGLYVAGTAAGGTQQRYELFLENCHVHVDRITAHLTGSRSHAPDPVFAAAET